MVSMALVLSRQDSAVVWRGPIKMVAIKQFLQDVNWGDLDFLLIDLPPGTSDEPLSVLQIIPDLTGAIIVTTPQGVFGTGLPKGREHDEKHEASCARRR